MSMAAGEFVSVSTQSDTEKAEIAKETDELRTVPDRELEELTQIYIGRGLDRDLAQKVATRLQEVDPIGTHLREELGIIQTNTARPLQAALASSVSFSLGAAIPLLALLLAPKSDRIAIIAVTALVVLAVTGAVASRLGGSSPTRGALRVFIGGGLAMAVTALIGNLIGGAV
jgi:VIT1/CCC1 family predicted Fe2+/Mn2+ transporter